MQNVIKSSYFPSLSEEGKETAKGYLQNNGLEFAWAEVALESIQACFNYFGANFQEYGILALILRLIT